MKTTILSLVTIFFSFTAHADDLRIKGWSANIPTEMSNVIEVLQSEAGYYSFDTDEGQCGGEIAQPVLLDHHVGQGQDGKTLNEVTVGFELSKAKNYCESVVHTNCQARVQIEANNNAADEITLESWNCEN